MPIALRDIITLRRLIEDRQALYRAAKRAALQYYTKKKAYVDDEEINVNLTFVERVDEDIKGWVINFEIYDNDALECSLSIFVLNSEMIRCYRESLDDQDR